MRAGSRSNAWARRGSLPARAVALLLMLMVPAVDGADPVQAPGASTGPGAARGDGAAVPQEAAAPPPAEAFRSRLERLDPERPIEYLELAEEVQAAARNDDDRRLARTLYGLAGAIDPTGLGASAALGQATLAATPGERVRLVRLAAALSDSRHPSRDARDPSPSTVRFAQLLAAYRRGDGSRARDLIGNPEVAALVESYGASFEGGAVGFRNAVIALRDKPLDSDARRLESMFLEQSLLSGGRSFASDLIRSNDEPLAACDPLDPGPEFGVDRRTSWWRGGRWVSIDPGGGAAPAGAPAAAGAAAPAAPRTFAPEP